MDNERDEFLRACFMDHDQRQAFYRDIVRVNPARLDHFLKRRPDLLEHRYWIPSCICRVTGEPLTHDTIGMYVGYWTPFLWKVVRRDLCGSARAHEVAECQRLDMNCNDCLHMRRMDQYHGLCSIKDGLALSLHPGDCMPENINCFKHRKDP